jgi:hypothetical protein
MGAGAAGASEQRLPVRRHFDVFEMHMMIYALVEASTHDDALATGKTVFDRLVGADPRPHDGRWRPVGVAASELECRQPDRSDGFQRQDIDHYVVLGDGSEEWLIILCAQGDRAYPAPLDHRTFPVEKDPAPAVQELVTESNDLVEPEEDT